MKKADGIPSAFSLKRKRPPVRTNRRAVFPRSGFFLNLGKSALHIAAAQATGAHVHSLRSAFNNDPDTLHIGRPDPMAFAVGMADIVSVQRTLLANLTKLTHGNPPPYGESHIKPDYIITVQTKKQAYFS